MMSEDFNQKPSLKSCYFQPGINSADFANGVGLQMTLIFYIARPLRVRASTIAAIANFHGLVHGGSRSFNEKEVICRHCNDLWFVKVVCTLLVRSNYFSDTCVRYLSDNLNPLISFEVIKRLNDPKLGLKFLEFSRLNLSLNHSVKTYNLLLRSLCEMGLHDSAKVVFDYARRDGQMLDGPMIEFFILSCIKAGKVDVVKKLLSQFQPEEIKMNTLMYNSLLNLLVKQNEVDEAVWMFKEHFRLLSQPDTWTFNILIRGLCRIGEVTKAFEFFNDMGSFGCSPDIVTYNTLINGLCRVNEVDRGRELLKEVKFRSEFSPDVVTYTSIICGYCKLGKMEEAAGMYDEMVRSGITPSAVTFNVLIDGFGKVGNMVSAESMHKRMLSFGYLPDVVTFSSLIDGYCRNGQLNQGLKLWDEMHGIDLSPNVYTFAILINALCKENRLNEARLLLSQLKWSDLVPKPFMYNPVIDGFCKAGSVDEANKIVAEMEEKRCKPDKGIRGAEFGLSIFEESNSFEDKY
ncbi:Pentatricopeptide repeat-containing protein [Melia azedarach]|uniref:Pentatricopeptide repeat-containing protein n=1 Tax=Melia azedarach TaxID=155640 RepID=A0ACC1XBV2_MELAZ|nr:Pentatricopeptide repeat-containing protein [Melia azedarach]